MTTRFAINGLGRVGRALVRVASRYPGLELVAVNDPATPEQVAHLLRYDTVHGRAEEEIGWEAGALRLGGRRVPLSNAATPEAIDWGGTAPAIVVEATGRFRQRALAAGHLRGGVERVIVSAILPDADATFCIGINEETFDPARHRVISNASCTTNCLAPLLRVLDRAFGVERALMNTVHCMTNSQQLVDMAHPDPRRARAAPANIIPTTSDAIPSIGWVMPEMAGRVEGLAMRVPIVAGSLVDLTVLLARSGPRWAPFAAGTLAGLWIVHFAPHLYLHSEVWAAPFVLGAMLAVPDTSTRRRSGMATSTARLNELPYWRAGHCSGEGKACTVTAGCLLLRA